MIAIFPASPHFFLRCGQALAIVAMLSSGTVAAMTRFGAQIDTVVLHDSGGGDSEASRSIGRDIRKRKLRTVVHGRCSSACANMFLGGSVRQFAFTEGEITAVLGFHGTYYRPRYSTLALALTRTGTNEYFLEMTEGKMDAEFVERFIRRNARNRRTH